METLVWNLHAMVTWALFGLIWTVQVVVYPQFLEVGVRQWNSYHDNHMRTITWVVAPLMLVELASAIYLLLFPPVGLDVNALWFFGPGLIALTWAITGAVSVPLHGRLAEAWELKTVRKLIRTNWLRTVTWTMRAVWVFMVSSAVQGP